jgi:hypothetical protein
MWFFKGCYVSSIYTHILEEAEGGGKQEKNDRESCSVQEQDTIKCTENCGTI